MFDIDGTLLDPQGEGTACMRSALEEVYGTAGPIESYNMAGKTDWLIVTELMHLAGLDPQEVTSRLQSAFSAYARQVAQAGPILSMRALPGVPDLLNRLAGDNRFLLGLLTGNVKEAVPYKLRAAGLDPNFFRFGAFGSEHIDRNELPAMALARAGRFGGRDVMPQAALVIGDTPRDIACARYAGLKVLCVATGTYPYAALAEFRPDYLLESLEDMDEVMAILTGYS